MLKKVLKGFTLIELMIVVAIIGILAAIAVPNFVKFQCRSKQSEAKGNLKSLYVAQESYRAEYDTYETAARSCSETACTTLSNAIGWQPKGQRIRYQYSYSSTVTSTWSGNATPGSNFGGELQGDTWNIDHINQLTNSVNGCNK